MKFSKLVQGAIVALAAAGIVLPQAQVAAATKPAVVKTVKTTNAPVLDVALTSNRALVGRVVDRAGTAKAGVEVVVRQGTVQLAKATTDEHGTFVVQNLKGGTYEVASGATVGAYRVWTEGAAPQNAGEQALLVLGENGTRGQFGSIGGGVLLLSGVAIAALIVGIVAIDKANDVEDEVAQIPKS